MQSVISRYIRIFNIEFYTCTHKVDSILVSIPGSNIYIPTASPFLIPITNTMVKTPEDVHEKLHSVTNEAQDAIDEDLHRRALLPSGCSVPGTPSDICFPDYNNPLQLGRR